MGPARGGGIAGDGHGGGWGALLGAYAGRLCYAESTDGVHWERPDLGLVSYRGSGDNNILGPAVHDPVRQAGWNAGTVFKDPTAPPQQRYKLWSEIKVGEEGKSGLTGFCSPDGLRWTPCGNNPLPGHLRLSERGLLG